jgi:hypothetical protein
MIKFEYDGPLISHQKACWKRYDGANVLRWNFEMKENTYELKVVKYHMLSLSVVGIERCCCQLVLRLQEGRDINQP